MKSIAHPPIAFDFVTAPKIVFGAGRFAEAGAIAAGLGRRVCLVTGGASLKRTGRLDALVAQFGKAGIERVHVKVTGEPAVEDIDEMTARARDFRADCVMAIGGGSALDAGKAVAALLANGGAAIDYLEGAGRGATLTERALPFIAIPTTAGTGSEVTKNAVIGDRAKTFKKSMRSDSMMAAVALVDPELTCDCPPEVTAACGMDAVAQCLESFTATRATPMTRALSTEGLRLARALPELMDRPEDPALRESMAMASLLGGICLANAGLGAVHGLASPLGAMFPAPHGAVCAATLPGVIRANARRAGKAGNARLLADYAHAESLLTHGADSVHGDAPERLAELFESWIARMKLPGLAQFGVTCGDFERIASGARGNSMKTNPAQLTDEDLMEILAQAL